VENTEASKMLGWKMREWIYRHHTAELQNVSNGVWTAKSQINKT